MKKYDVTIHDPKEEILPKLAESLKGKSLLCLFPAGNSRYLNVEYFAPNDPILTADSMKSDRSSKTAFLQSAPTAIVMVTDLRALSIFTTALSMLLKNKLLHLHAATQFPAQVLTQTATHEEQQAIRNALAENRLVIDDHIHISRVIEQLGG
ncbi:hypothetical protein [Bradyrhizobium sp. ORS 375]|uniref:hypothetical protein n=1 Tax=Bradyrhizobium sp. (strain ORS 375) TaxID=566679 RepID=UPI00111202A5|nr:hypothetical protein [Bradyrhizobium sp. ORS 375]